MKKIWHGNFPNNTNMWTFKGIDEETGLYLNGRYGITNDGVVINGSGNPIKDYKSIQAIKNSINME